MNKLILLTTIFLLSMFTSCKEEAELQVDLEGTWSLINYNGGLAGVNEDIEKGTYTLTFSSSTVAVVDTNDSFNWIEEGTYKYSVSDQGEVRVLIINDIEMGVYVKSGARFTVDQRAADGFQYVFTK